MFQLFVRTANTVGVVPWKRGSTRENVSVVVAREPKGCVLRLSVDSFVDKVMECSGQSDETFFKDKCFKSVKFDQNTT